MTSVVQELCIFIRYIIKIPRTDPILVSPFFGTSFELARGISVFKIPINKPNSFVGFIMRLLETAL